MTASETDPDRRLALQLAIQLPPDVARARHVLALTEEVLAGFMIEPRSQAHARARRLGWGEGGGSPAASRYRPPLGRRRSDAFAPYLWALAATLLVTLPLAIGLSLLLGVGGGLALSSGVVITALVFGTAPALMLALLSPILLNLIVIPPAFQFSRPVTGEYVLAVFCLAMALGVPWLARRRARLRRVAKVVIRPRRVAAPLQRVG